LEGLSGWVEQSLLVSVAPGADCAAAAQEVAQAAEPPVVALPAPLPGAWQRLGVARQSVHFACVACNQALEAHNQAVNRLPARLVATLMGARELPLLTVIDHG
jgi:hypothetical protein